MFIFASLVTLGAGVLLEVAGATLAERANVNGVIFGATVLAFATALPEISSGIAAVRLGDHQLAVADIFGGNAFQVCLFLRRRPGRGAAGAAVVGRPERLACRPGDRADGRLRVRRDRALGALPAAPRRRLVRRASLLFALGMAGLYAIAHP